MRKANKRAYSRIAPEVIKQRHDFVKEMMLAGELTNRMKERQRDRGWAPMNDKDIAVMRRELGLPSKSSKRLPRPDRHQEPARMHQPALPMQIEPVAMKTPILSLHDAMDKLMAAMKSEEVSRIEIYDDGRFELTHKGRL